MLDFFVLDPIQKQLVFQKTVDSQEQAEGLANTHNQSIMFATYEFSHKDVRKHKRFDDIKYFNTDPVDIYKISQFWKGKTCTMTVGAPQQIYRFNPMYSICPKSGETKIRDPFPYEFYQE
jgi:hypothetical protein